jgi:hypothetical protein
VENEKELISWGILHPQALSIFGGTLSLFVRLSKHILTIFGSFYNILGSFFSVTPKIFFSEFFNQFICDFYVKSARNLEWTDKSGLIG